jgi:hypothetical protein
MDNLAKSVQSLYDKFHLAYPCTGDCPKVYNWLDPNCKSMVVLLDGGFRGVKFTDMISPDFGNAIPPTESGGTVSEVNSASTSAKSTLVSEVNSTSASVESEIKRRNVAYEFHHLKSELRDVNREVDRVKIDIPIYIATPVDTDPNPRLIAKLERSEHVQNAIKDSYLLQKLEYIKSVHAAEAAKELAKAEAEAKAAALKAKFHLN